MAHLCERPFEVVLTNLERRQIQVRFVLPDQRTDIQSAS